MLSLECLPRAIFIKWWVEKCQEWREVNSGNKQDVWTEWQICSDISYENELRKWEKLPANLWLFYEDRLAKEDIEGTSHPNTR